MHGSGPAGLLQIIGLSCVKKPPGTQGNYELSYILKAGHGEVGPARAREISISAGACRLGDYHSSKSTIHVDSLTTNWMFLTAAFNAKML